MVFLLVRGPPSLWTHPWVVKTPENTDVLSAILDPGEHLTYQAGVKSATRRSHAQSVERDGRQEATTVQSLDSLLSPDRSDREMAEIVCDLEDESAEARARALEFLIVAKAQGKPEAVRKAWEIL